MFHRNPIIKKIIAYTLCLPAVLLSVRTSALAANDAQLEAVLEEQRAMPVQTNELANWPAGPVVSAASAILIEAETGTILYAKNIHDRMYPASTTKIMTTLLATELCELDEVVTFSHDAVFDTPRNSNHIAMDVGQQLTVEQCLNAILIRSANEVSYAIAEHISGTSDWSVFAETMNKRAVELGALDTNFVNPNGLPDENHYTTAYDLAMIGRAFFDNELLCKITLTKRLEIPASDTIPVAKLENNGMQIIPTGSYAYGPLIGCKTGYTEASRYCLVSAAEKDGLKLICVVMKDENPYHYEDTISLFNYGFSNFEKLYVASSDTKYNISSSNMFYNGNDIFGSSSALLSLEESDYVIMPKNIAFDKVDSTIDYSSKDSGIAAVISYAYKGNALGTVRVNFIKSETDASSFDTVPVEETEPKIDKSAVFVDVVKILIGVGIFFGFILFILFIKAIRKRYAFSSYKRRREWKQTSRRRKRANRRKSKLHF